MRRRFVSKAGWTLFEILVALAIAATIAGAVALGIQEPMKEAKGKQCATNLAMIEGAKDEFSRDNPGVALTSIDQLKPYLRYGIPTCPAGGTYDHILDLNQRCTCSLNGTDQDPDKPPGVDKMVNGYHDLGQP